VAVKKNLNPKTVSVTANGSLVVEPYTLTELTHGDGDNWQGLLPAKGMPHPNQVRYPGASVDGYVLIQRLSHTAVIGGVVYKTPGRFVGATNSASETENAEFAIKYPVVRRNTSDSGDVLSLEWLDSPMPRRGNVRTEYRVMADGTFTKQQVQKAVSQNMNCLFTLDTLLYVFIGANMRTDGLGRLYVNYKFMHTGAVKGAPVSSTYFNNFVAIPDLPVLGEWGYAETPTSYTVTVRQPTDIYFPSPVALPKLFPL
jgi:hypothetical protein